MPTLTWQLLRKRTFRRVWLGESVSMLGDQVHLVAFTWLVLEVSGSATILAAVLIATGLPRAGLLLLGGAVTDQLSPRTLMLASHLFRGVILTGLIVLTVSHTLQVWHLFVIGAAFGAADAFFWPAAGAILPSLVSPAELPGANALAGAAEQAAMLAGPVAGGALVAAGGPALAFEVNAISFFLAALTVRAAPRVTRPVDTRQSVWSDIRSGLGYAVHSPELRAVLLVVAAGSLTYNGLFGVGVPALARSAGPGALALGAMVSAWGLGQLVGTLLATVTGLPRRWGWLIIAVALCEGATFAILGFIANVWAVAALFVPLGALVAYQSDVALPTWIQSRTPQHLLGRVNSIVELHRTALAPVSIAVMGTLVALDLRAPFWAASVPMVVAGVTLAATRTGRELGGEPRPEEL